MESTTEPDSTSRGPGRPRRDLGELEKEQFVTLVKEGVGRCLALQELGFSHHKILARAFKDDPDFLGRVQLAEKALNEKLLYHIVDAALSAGKADPELNKTALTMKQKVASMVESRRAARKLEGIAEREIRLKEGQFATDDREDLSILDPAEFAAMDALESGEALTDEQRLAYARAAEKLAKARIERAKPGHQG